MQLLPQQIGDVDPIIRWGIETRLQLIEEVALGPQTFGIGAPGKEEAMRVLSRSLGRDWKADAEAFDDCMRTEMGEWWRYFREPELLTALYRRAARRRAECGSPDGRRRPSHSEGLLVARALLVDLPNVGRLDSAWEHAAVSTVLAAILLPPLGVTSPGELRKYIEHSETTRVYFDAIGLMCEEIHKRQRALPRPLFRWQQQATGGHRRRPPQMPVAPHRPVNPAKLLHDVQIQFIIEILRRVGVRPNARDVSGCRIVSEALECEELSEETVRRIWKERIWRRPFQHEIRKYSKAIAERTGPAQYHTEP